MKKSIELAALVALIMLVPLAVAQATTEPTAARSPVVVDVELVEPDVLRLSFSESIAPSDLWGIHFHVENYATTTEETFEETDTTITLKLSRRLVPGVTYALVVENWLQGDSRNYSFVAVETIAVGDMQGKILSRNSTVLMTRNAIAMVEAGHEALLEGRQALFDAYTELDRAFREFPELELPYEEPASEFEERMNDLFAEAHGQARAALISNREALVDQVINTEYQREDILTNLAKAKLQSELAVKQLTLAGETYILAFHSISDQMTGLEANLALLKRQVDIADIQVSLGMLGSQDARKLSETVREIENAIAALAQQRESVVAELNLLLGQAHDTPLRIAVPIPDFSAVAEEVDYIRDLPIVRAGNLTLQSLAADVAQKARAVGRNAVGTPERTIAEYELQNARIRVADEERKLSLSFRRLVDDLTNKLSSLHLAEDKYERQSVVFGYSELRYQLGMISALQLESDRLELFAARRAHEEAGRDLLMALNRYRFMLDGLTL